MQKMSEKEAITIIKSILYEYRKKKFGENALHMAIQALELLQQYRATGMTPEQIKEIQMDYCAKGAVLEEYKAIGTVEELRADKAQMMLKKYGSFSEMIDAVAEYSVIGTVEKCREAVERMKPIYIFGSDYNWTCSVCGTFHSTKGKYCSECGHKIELY